MSAAPLSPRARRMAWLALLALAVPVYALRRWGDLGIFHWDAARIPVPAVQILDGTFPVHQVGVEYFGAAAAYPLAAWFALLGPSTLAVDLFCLMVATAIAGSGYLVARRFLAERSALIAGLVLAAPPLFLGRFAMSSNLNYPVNLLMGNLVLLGTHTAVFRRRNDPATLFALGLVAGIGWWNHPMIVAYCAPFAVLALRTGLVRRLPFWLFPLGVLVGGLPDWAFEIAHYPSARLVLHEAGHAEAQPTATRAATFLLEYTRELLGARLTGLAVFKLDPPALVQAALIALGGLAAGRALIRDRAELRWLVGAGGRPGSGLAALWAIVLVVVALTMPTDRPLHATYFLPLYGVLPLWYGELFGWLWGVRRGLSAALLGAFVAFNLWGSWALSLGPRTRATPRWAALESRVEPLVRWLAERGIGHVYYAVTSIRSFELSFLAARRVIAANLWDEPVVQHAWAVDVQPAPPIVTTRAELATLRDGLRAVGHSARETEVGSFVVVEPAPAARTGFAPIAPDGWTLTASHREFEAGHLVDRDVATQWSTGDPQTPGQWLAVDLGAVRAVARLDLLATDWQEVPSGFRVEWSGDGATWQEAVSVPRYWGPFFVAEGHPFLRVRRGRVQAVFGPVRARFLRVVQTGSATRAWSARELFVYGPAPPAPPTPAEEALVPDLRAHGVRMVYAGHRLSARVLAEARGGMRALDSNLLVNSYGRRTPDPSTLERFRLRAGSAVLLGIDADGPAIRGALAAQGALARETTAGGYPLLLLSPPRARPALPRDGWRAAASVAPATAGLAIDGTRTTRWSVDGPPGPAVSLTLDLGRARRVGGLRMRPGSREGSPSAFALEGSIDGDAWRRLEPLTWIGPLYWTGYELLRNGRAQWAVAFPPATLRHLRIRPAAPGRRWVIEDVELLE